MTQPTTPAARGEILRLRAETSLDDDAMRTLRRFHLGVGDEPAAALDPGLVPAALHPYRGRLVRGPYPLFVSRGDAGVLFVRPLPALLEETAPALRTLRDNLRRLEAGVRDRLAGHSRGIAAADVVKAAGRDVARDLSLPTEEARALEGAIAELVETLPPGGFFLSLTESTAFDLLALAAESRYEGARSAHAPELAELVETASRMLNADAEARDGRRPESVAVSLGALGGRFLDSGALAGLSTAAHRGRALSDPRRDALRSARETLSSYLAEPPLSRCVTIDTSLEASEGWSIALSTDPCERAIALFDSEAERLANALRAAHRIRLESRGDFDPARHEPWLRHLSWESFDREEIALLPPIVALTTVPALHAGGMAALSGLLLSGRPIQVLVAFDSGIPDEDFQPASYRFEPAFVGLAYREAFVQQTSVARPEILLEGFRKALASPRAGLHAVSGVPAPTAGSLDPWLMASALLEGRCEPQFRYDPEAGGTWARRLTLLDNPDEAEDWTTHTLRVRRSGGEEELLPVAFTAADSLLLSPRAAGHFSPAGGTADDLEPLASWLQLDVRDAAPKLPFVWGVDPDGHLRRLVVSRRLAGAIRDRLGFWRTLQELAGIRNEHVDEAARHAREEARAAAKEEWRRLEAEHAEELTRVRVRAAEEAVDRLLASLFELDAGELGPQAGPAPFADRDVDELAASLLEVVRGANGDGSTGAEASGDEQLDRLAGELMSLVAEEPTTREPSAPGEEEESR